MCSVRADRTHCSPSLADGCGNLYEDAADLSTLDTATAVVSRLYAKTGLSVRDVGVAEVHDCFSIAELLMYEAIGLAGHGQGASVAKDGVSNRLWKPGWLRLPRWTRWVEYHLRNLGGWVVGRGGLEGGWSDVSPPRRLHARARVGWSDGSIFA